MQKNSFSKKIIKKNYFGIYIANIDYNKNDPYFKKIQSQRNHFKKFFKNFKIIFKRKKKLIIHTYIQFYIDIIKSSILIKNRNFFIYIRHPRHNFFFFIVLLFLKIKKKTIIIEEIPTFPLEILKLNFLSFEIINFSQYFFRFLTNLLIDNYTAIGNEGYFYNKKVCNIYNGIDSCNYLPRKSSAKINFIFVGNNAQRHGLRRLIATFKKSNNKRLIKKVHINFVGKFHKDEQLFLSNELRRINVSFKFFGYLVGSELVKVLKISNYGIGNLGFFSENIKFTSALKERMYISHMIPFVYSGKDKNLSKFKKLALKVPNSNQALNLKKILEHKKKFYELKKIKISRLRIDLETSFNWPNTLKSTDELFKKL